MPEKSDILSNRRKTDARGGELLGMMCTYYVLSEPAVMMAEEVTPVTLLAQEPKTIYKCKKDTQGR